MVRVRLVDVFVEHRKKEFRTSVFGKRNTRWYAAVALHLIDEPTRESLAEWFYLVVCSKKYEEKPFRKGPVLHAGYLVIQDEFDLNEVFSIALKKMEKINANSWDDFYEQMQKEFLYDD